MSLRVGGLLLMLVLGGLACIKSIEPKIDFTSGLLFISGFAVSEPGLSLVEIKTSLYEGEDYSLPPVPDAKVILQEIDSGREVIFQEDSSGLYLGPVDFFVSVGESWQLKIELADGTRYESSVEKVTPEVPIDAVEVDFSEEVKFDVTRNRFVPGHRILLDWQDPAGETNYYLWRYRSFEKIRICKTCINGQLRNGICERNPGPGSAFDYFNYLCDVDCWMIRYSEEFQIFEDAFSDGLSINKRQVATVPYYRDRNVLVELQQLSLSESAYQYYRIINDLIANNAGFNGTIPTPLLGNVKNSNDATEVVLGQFVTSKIALRRLFIDRSDLPVDPIGIAKPLMLESCLGCPTEYPCMEGVYRTRVEPEGWIE